MNPTPTHPQEILEVDFKKRTYTSLGGGLYKRDGAYYERPKIGATRSMRKLNARAEKSARLELAARRSDQARATLGLAKDPYKISTEKTIAHLATFYLEHDCPQRNETPRAGKQLVQEKSRVTKIIEHFGKRAWNTLTNDDARAYHTARLAQITRGTGHRSVDMELVTLSAMLRWAQRNPRQTGVTTNPIAHERTRFCDPKKVRHCRDVQPASAEELHQLATYLFQNPQSQVLGWQLLFEAYTGHRTHEILKLRLDATTEDHPGHVHGHHLFLYTSETSKGTYPYIEIHAALRQCLDHHRAWHAERFPTSPWYFPSPCLEGATIVDNCALTRALTRATAQLKLPKRTSHGLRSFYVNVLRSKGIPDAEIALRIGHKSGGKLIVNVYGKILPTKLTWLPKTDPPAWCHFTPDRPTQLDLAF